jgi:hypothetical protein
VQHLAREEPPTSSGVGFAYKLHAFIQPLLPSRPLKVWVQPHARFEPLALLFQCTHYAAQLIYRNDCTPYSYSTESVPLFPRAQCARCPTVSSWQHHKLVFLLGGRGEKLSDVLGNAFPRKAKVQRRSCMSWSLQSFHQLSSYHAPRAVELLEPISSIDDIERKQPWKTL